MTSPRPYTRASKASQIRKLLKTTTLTPKQVAERTKCEVSYVYYVKSLVKKALVAETPTPPAPATMPVLGIAGLPTNTVTITSAPQDFYEATKGRQTETIYKQIEAAHAASEIEDGAIEKKHRKETMVYIAVFAVFAAALAIYIFAR